MNTVAPSSLSGTITAPSSKSAAQRAIACACLAHGSSTLQHLTRCADVRAALHMAQGLGAQVDDLTDGGVRITGNPRLQHTTFNAGESGTSFRLFAPILCLFDQPVTLKAEGSLRKRPMHMVRESLVAFGAEVQSANSADLPPLRLRGPLRAGKHTLDAGESSQVLSGLLLALPCLEQASTIHAPNSVSKPYLSMTLEMLATFGITVRANEQRTTFHIAGNQNYQPTELSLEGDYSGAAFLFAAAALGGELTVRGLRWPSNQADAAILSILKDYGAEVIHSDEGIRVVCGDRKPFQADATHCPDVVPPLVALACHAQGTSEIKGARRLIHKESNRAQALKTEFGKLGCSIEIDDDRLVIHGGRLHGGLVSCHQDHRIAMSLAVAALAATDAITLEGSSCVDKSYPEFFQDLARVKGKVS